MTGRRLSVAIAVLLLAGCGSNSAAGARLPDAPLVALTGSATVSAAQLGGPAVVNLWATWCVPCRTELPAFQAVDDALGTAVRFVGVNQGDDAAAVSAYLTGAGVHFDQYLDRDGRLADALGVTGLPATAIVAADGTVLALHQGQLSEADLRSMLRDELHIG